MNSLTQPIADANQRSTTEVLAEVSQAQWLWKSLELLAIAPPVLGKMIGRKGKRIL